MTDEPTPDAAARTLAQVETKWSARVEKLQAEVAALKKLLFRARSSLDELMGDSDLDSDDTPEMRVCQDISKVLEGETGQLVDDMERLNFLEKNHVGLLTWDADDPNGDPMRHGFIVETYGIEFARDTPRAAIDAAMNKKESR